MACLLGNHRRVIELVDGGADVWASDADEKTPIGHVDLKAINPKTLEDDPLSVKFLANIHKIHEYLQAKMVEAAARATHVEGTEYGDIEPDGNHIQEDSPEKLVARHTKYLERYKSDLGETNPRTLRQMSDLADAYQLTEDGYEHAESLELELREK